MDVPLERRVMHMTHKLPTGWKFTPLHKNCPQCGFDLSHQFVESEADKDGTENVESDASKFLVSRMAGNNTARVISSGTHECGLKWMVDPLAKADEKTAKRNNRNRNRGKRREHPSPGSQENHDAYGHKHLVPVIKGKPREWVIHVFAWLRG